MRFGIVCTLDRNNFKSHAKIGVVCEVLEFDLDSTVTEDSYGRKPAGYVHVKAVAQQRFRIDKVLHRALDGLILTTESEFIEEANTDADLALS